ncbi:MAG: class I SAM-dependent methyltransferase [Betaproteobacteria bacterium]|nr:class I SAM-dependent methyltransferase [Betaproteobacteria bacterium]
MRTWRQSDDAGSGRRNAAVRVFTRAGAWALAAGCFGASWGGEPTVPYVPTPQEVVEKMLEIAKVGPQDYVIDLGSGDGRIVITAARKYGARGFGVDLNPERIEESLANARAAGVTGKVAFYRRDLFETDLSEATVITMYLLPRVNLALRPKLLELKPGTRIVSHDFSMDEWKADRHVSMEAKAKYGGSGGRSDIYFWIVPAKAGGVWQWQMPVGGRTLSYEMTLDQKYQMVSGSVKVGGRTVKLRSAKLTGDEIGIAFTAEINGQKVKHAFSGRVAGDTVEGRARLSGGRLESQVEWTAKRGARSAGAAAPRDALLSAASAAR